MKSQSHLSGLRKILATTLLASTLSFSECLAQSPLRIVPSYQVQERIIIIESANRVSHYYVQKEFVPSTTYVYINLNSPRPLTFWVPLVMPYRPAPRPYHYEAPQRQPAFPQNRNYHPQYNHQRPNSPPSHRR